MEREHIQLIQYRQLQLELPTVQGAGFFGRQTGYTLRVIAALRVRIQENGYQSFY